MKHLILMSAFGMVASAQASQPICGYVQQINAETEDSVYVELKLLNGTPGWGSRLVREAFPVLNAAVAARKPLCFPVTRKNVVSEKAYVDLR